MLKNYLKIALRNLRRQKAYATINLLGLSVGLAACLLLALYVRHELSFDTYHANLDRLYRLVDYGGFGEKHWDSYIPGDPVTPMREAYDDVEDAVKVMNCEPNRIEHEGETFRDITTLCTESNLFNLFSFSLVQGDPATVLDAPNTAVITRALAERLFADADPVGQSLMLPVPSGDGETVPVRITGLMEDVPPNTHFTFDLLRSYATLQGTRRCLTCGQPMYALLAPGADPEAVAARITQHVREVDGEEYVEEVRLEPLAEVHFSDIYSERQGDRRLVLILGSIALVLLLIACANYMNLATARYAHRTREVGVRKALGALRGQLAGQFLLEALLLTLLAFPLALGLALIALPHFNELARSEIVLDWRSDGLLVLGGLGLLVLVGLLAGSYPAFFLSGFRPDAALRGQGRFGFTAAGLRRVLVVLQFTVCIGMIALTGVVLAQLRYVQAMGLGFDEEGVVLVEVTDPELIQDPERMKEEFGRIAAVERATAGNGMPGQQGFRWVQETLMPEGTGEGDEDGAMVTFINAAIDADFVDAMGLELLAGRNIVDWDWDNKSFRFPEGLINESGMRAMGWTRPEEAIGERVSMGQIVGVVRDFHFQSLHQEVMPLIMVQNTQRTAGTIALRIRGEDVAGTIAALERTWARLGSADPFVFSFLSDEWAQLYEQEQRAAQVFGLFAGLAVALAALGLFGLAAFAAERRTKEIGIRKVLGASRRSIVGLLFQETGLLLVVAFVLAAPLAYVAAQRWLEAFAFRIDVGPLVFIVAGTLALAVAFISTALQSLHAAGRNPADSLRYE